MRHQDRIPPHLCRTLIWYGVAISDVEDRGGVRDVRGVSLATADDAARGGDGLACVV